jgi:hypothetical protein
MSRNGVNRPSATTAQPPELAAAAGSAGIPGPDPA